MRPGLTTHGGSSEPDDRSGLPAKLYRMDAQRIVHIGRYDLHDEIASGGMGSVHLGRLRGAAGFSRIVAIKRLHPSLGKDPGFLRMFLDEARLAGRVRHPHVVPTFDVVEADGEVLIVMEYVHGESLARLLKLNAHRGQRLSPAITSAVMSGVLYGLHAAHEATDEAGTPLGLVHRDVSPQNVLVGADGIARVVDLGVAKATGRLQTTTDGRLKGKLSYMSPEQIQGESVDRRTDVYAAGVVLWEALTGARLFQGTNEANTISKVLLGRIEAPSARAPGLPQALDALVLRALSRQPSDRFSSAREMGAALLQVCPAAAPHEVGEWVEACAQDTLSARAGRAASLEGRADASAVRSPPPAPTRGADLAEVGVGSQVSRVSVTVPHSAERAGGMRRGFLLAIAACGLGAALFVLGTRYGRAAPEPAPPVSAVSATPAPLESMTEPAASEPPVAASAAPAPSNSASHPSAPVKPSSVGHARSTPASTDCNPPYSRGPDGRKMWKRQCFEQAP